MCHVYSNRFWITSTVHSGYPEPLLYTAIFSTLKIDNLQMKKCDIFSYYCSKHKLWVHVRAATLCRFLRVHKLYAYVFDQTFERERKSQSFKYIHEPLIMRMSAYIPHSKSFKNKYIQLNLF